MKKLAEKLGQRVLISSGRDTVKGKPSDPLDVITEDAWAAQFPEWFLDNITAY